MKLKINTMAQKRLLLSTFNFKKTCNKGCVRVIKRRISCKNTYIHGDKHKTHKKNKMELRLRVGLLE